MAIFKNRTTGKKRPQYSIKRQSDYQKKEHALNNRSAQKANEDYGFTRGAGYWRNRQ